MLIRIGVQKTLNQCCRNMYMVGLDVLEHFWSWRFYNVLDSQLLKVIIMWNVCSLPWLTKAWVCISIFLFKSWDPASSLALFILSQSQN